MGRASRPISPRGSGGSREGMSGDPAGVVGSGFGAEEQLHSRALRARCPLPPWDPRLSCGGRKPEAAPTVGSVLPLVLHGRRRSVRESRPVRPQPGQPGGSAGCSAPPRVREARSGRGQGTRAGPGLREGGVPMFASHLRPPETLLVCLLRKEQSSSIHPSSHPPIHLPTHPPNGY